jgi:hypothetical protein
LQASGGFVDSEGYVNGALSVSRVLGDFHLDMKNDHPDEQPGALTAEPDVTVRVLSRDDEFMILASDGLWDVFNSQNAVELARESLRMHNDPAKCSRDLVSATSYLRPTSYNILQLTVHQGHQVLHKKDMRRRSQQMVNLIVYVLGLLVRGRGVWSMTYHSDRAKYTSYVITRRVASSGDLRSLLTSAKETVFFYPHC